MAIQISGAQIKSNAVSAAKMDLSSGTFDFSSATVVVATPTADGQAATKAYVDAIASGLSWKAPVKAASTANLTLSGTQTVDGVSLLAGDRVLVKDQSTGSENGIYVVASGSWARSTDMDAGSEFPSASVFVQQGTVSADVGYVCTNDSVTLGSTAIVFVQFNGASNIVAGDGLSKVGNTLDVNVDGVTIEISSDALQIKDLGVGTAKLADASVESAKIASNAVTSAKIAANAVGSTQIADNSVVTAKLSDGSVTSSKIVDSSIVSVKLASDSVTTAKIVDANVTSAKLASDSVTTAKILDANVTTAKIADSAVTNAKLAGSIGADKLSIGNGVQSFNDAGTFRLQASIAPDYLAFSTGAIDINFQSRWKTLAADSSTTTFDLDVILKSKLSNIMVFKNGIALEQVASSPSGSDQYSVALNVGGKGQVTFGAAPSSSDNIRVFYIA